MTSDRSHRRCGAQPHRRRRRIRSTLSLRGLDNATYYRLQPGAPRYYVTTPAAAIFCDGPCAAGALCARRLAGVGRVWRRRRLSASIWRQRGAPARGLRHRGAVSRRAAARPVLRDLKLIANLGTSVLALSARQVPGPLAEWNDRFAIARGASGAATASASASLRRASRDLGISSRRIVARPAASISSRA